MQDFVHQQYYEFTRVYIQKHVKDCRWQKPSQPQDPGGDDGEEDGVEGVGVLVENDGRENSVTLYMIHRAKKTHTLI